MSKVGKQIITIPQDVTVALKQGIVTVSGPKGELSMPVHRHIVVKVDDTGIVVTRQKERKPIKAMHGTTRNLLANMIEGVTKGFEKRLKLVGTGYRITPKGNDLELSLGFSHPVMVTAPKGITFSIEGNDEIIVTGIDKQGVGQAAANIRALRPPEPYKGKGIRYKDEVIIKKAGKAGKAEA